MKMPKSFMICDNCNLMFRFYDESKKKEKCDNCGRKTRRASTERDFLPKMIPSERREGNRNQA